MQQLQAGRDKEITNLSAWDHSESVKLILVTATLVYLCSSQGHEQAVMGCSEERRLRCTSAEWASSGDYTLSSQSAQSSEMFQCIICERCEAHVTR